MMTLAIDTSHGDKDKAGQGKKEEDFPAFAVSQNAAYVGKTIKNSKIRVEVSTGQ